MSELPKARGSIHLAPRIVPRVVVWRLLFGSRPGQVVWLFVLVTTVFAALFMTQTSLRTPDYDTRGTARITAVEDSHDGENDQTIYRVRYRFHVGARDVVGASYTLDEEYARSAFTSDGGPPHEVEYVAARPEASRLVGMRAAPFSKWIALIAVMPLIGLVIAGEQMRRGWKLLRLVRHGVETRGKLVSKQKIVGDGDDPDEYKLAFEYDVAGTKHVFEVTERDPEPLEDDALEPMVYDPFDPRRATTLDNLPGQISVGADGHIVSKHGAGWMLVLPVLSVVAMIVLATVMWG